MEDKHRIRMASDGGSLLLIVPSHDAVSIVATREYSNSRGLQQNQEGRSEA